MERIMCKKDVYNFIKHEMYEYWTNFGGLNHLVKNEIEVLPFDGPLDNPDFELHQRQNKEKGRLWIYDYFYTHEEMRDIKIDKIIN